MIITEDIDLGRNTIVKNQVDQIVSGIKSFNTETKEAEIYARFKVGDKFTTAVFVTQGDTTSIFQKEGEEKIKGEIVTFKCHLRGFKAYNRKTGEEIK